MRVLDLFCGAGGAAMGYSRAGFDVDGVDLAPHPDYPFPMIVADAMAVLEGRAGVDLDDYELVHASPPCPRYSSITAAAGRDAHPDLIGPVRDALRRWGGVYVIENVPGAPLDHPVTLCGSEFGLGTVCRDGRYRYLKRHRLFESSAPLWGAGGCRHRGQAVGVYGDGGGGFYPSPNRGGGYKAFPEEARAAMGIDWMTRDDLADAIPPSYTSFIGSQLIDQRRPSRI